MATTTSAQTRAAAARRVPNSGATVRPQTSRATMAAACYAGIIMLIALSVLAMKVWPTGPVAVLFVIGMVGLVAGLHPALRASRQVQ